MIKELLGWIYPRKCILCRNFLEDMDGEYICRLCYDKFDAEKQEILGEEQVLKKDIGYELAEKLALELDFLEDRPEQIIALFPYTNEYRKSILRWKYRGIRKYAKGFAELLVTEQKVFENVSVDAMIPVPLAPSRMRKRGFNQALDLAREIGKLANIPVWDCLKRIKDTKPQAACSREERYRNTEGSIAFVSSEKYTKEVNYVAIIDDIYTTGSTIKECIKILRKQYAFRNTRIVIVIVGKGKF